MPNLANGALCRRATPTPSGWLTRAGAARWCTPRRARNANAIEKALHERYKHCLGPGGLKIALAQRDGAGGTGGTLCDEYYVRMPLSELFASRSEWRCCWQVFITYNVDFKSGQLLGETREDCRTG